MRLCNKCEAGPDGLLGHKDLKLMDPKMGPRSSERFVLGCLGCGAQWYRVFASDGIRWIRADAPAA